MIDLLDFARGPALRFGLFVFCVGVVWRLVGALLLARKRRLYRPKDPDAWKGGVRVVFTRFWVKPDFAQATAWHGAIAYVYHLGLFIVLLFFVPHIQFFAGIVGFDWGGLPNGVITFVSAVSLLALLLALGRRLISPVLRRISTFDDYFSWTVLFLPFLTGMLATAHLVLNYTTMLAIHLLSVSLLLVWFPFSKLMHTFFFIPGRYELGEDFQRRGVHA